MVTERPRALRMLPIEAAVIPLPSDETTPPVTKTYLGNFDLPGVFQTLPAGGPAANPAACLGSWLQQEDLRFGVARTRVLDDQLSLRHRLGDAHLFKEGVNALEVGLEPGDPVMHRHHPARLDRAHHLGGPGRAQR